MIFRQLRWAMPLIALLLFGATARADDFKTHYDLAMALYQAQKFEEASAEFKAAYDLEPRPGLLFNIAQSHRKAGRLREAIEYYDRYLNTDPRIDTETRHKVDGYLAETRNTLAALELELKQRLAEEKAQREQEPAPKSEPKPEASPPPPPPALVMVEPKKPKTPLYKRWWFWTAVGGAVAVAAGVGIGVGVVKANQAPAPDAGVPIGILTF